MAKQTIKTAGRTLAPVARAAGKVLGPLGIGLVGYQVATAETTEEKVDAEINVVSTGLLMSKHPATMAAGAGLAIGQVMEKSYNISEYASTPGMWVTRGLRRLGIPRSVSVAAGAITTVSAVPIAIPVAQTHKHYQDVKRFIGW